jgi:outer membrane lipoprotein-sorting protein
MKYTVFFAIAMINLNVFAQYDPEALDILNSMSAKYKSMEAFSADFTQEMINESVGLSEKLKGEIIVKDNMYYLKVADQEVFNNGEDMWNYSKDIKEVTVAPYDPNEQEISLNNIFDIYQEGFKYVLMGYTEDGARIIDLDPESRDKTYYKIRMIINSQDELQKFTVFERKGNNYVYTIEKFEQLRNVPNSKFTFNTSKNPNVEVIDFR